MQRFDIATADGTCPAFLHTPDGAGPWPGVILFLDLPGIRPALHEIAERLSGAGYAVLLPDLFYRAGPYEPIDAKTVFWDPDLIARHRGKVAPPPPESILSDTRVLLDFLAERSEVAEGPVGVVGYCMGGRLALIAAGTFPSRIAVAASYHGGGLADDTPSSPHLLAPRMQARVYVAGATEDRSFDDAQKRRLEQALADARVDHVVETYPARHGWVPRDMPAHDPAEAEHHWRTLVPTLDSVLKR